MAEDFIRVYDDVIPRDLCVEIIGAFKVSPHRFPGRVGSGVDLRRKVSEDITLNMHPEWGTVAQIITTQTQPKLRSYVLEMKHLLLGSVSLTVTLRNGEQVLITDDSWDRVADDTKARAVEAGAVIDDATPSEILVDLLLGQMYHYGVLNMQGYAAGEGNYIHWHSEQAPTGDGDALHRVLLFMYYLNDVEEGGETEFYYQQRKIKPKAGRLVIAPASFTHTHRGNVPISGDKYIVTSWVKFRRVRPQQIIMPDQQSLVGGLK